MTTVADLQVRPTTTPSGYRRTFPRAVRSEWIKLATLRSTWWSIGVTAALTVALALLIASIVEGPGFPGIQTVVGSVQFTMLLAGILGAIAVTGEYSTGMIRSTLAADPIRGSVLAAKALVVAALMFVASLVMFAVAALGVSPILDAKGLGIEWSALDAGVLPILAAAFSMAVFALIGLAFGFVLRNGAGAIAATVAVLFVLPIVASVFPMGDPAWQWLHDAANHLPLMASQYLIVPQVAGGLSAAAALATLVGWVVAGMAASWAVLRVRDA